MADTDSSTEQCNIEQNFVHVQGVKTSILKLGHLRNKVPDGPGRLLMLLVPGNPGVPYYYEDFMQELYNQCNGEIPVWAISQAGHVRPPGENLTISNVVSTNESLYGLEAQVSHKVAFIREHIPQDVALILIGHSIGCYMILNALDDIAPRNVIRCFMLFPTVEKMSQTPNGRVFTPALRYFRWISVLLALFLCFFPQTIRAKIFQWYYRNLNAPECLQKGLMETVTPWTANFATYLAKIEMNKVTQLQHELVERHLHKLSWYYGTIDGWAPSNFYHDFVARFPQADARLCDMKLKHAFIMKRNEGKIMAKIIRLWAQSLKCIS